MEAYAAKAKEREAKERAEARARYEARLAGKKYHAPPTGTETLTSARSATLDLSAAVGKTMLVPAGAGVGRRGRGAGFYCEACDLTFKDNLQWVEHANSPGHLRNVGQSTEVARATAEDVRKRIEEVWKRKQAEAEEQQTGLKERLEKRKRDEEREREERRRKKKEAEERKREAKAKEEMERKLYGDDVRIEGEHDEDDMMKAMGFTGFGGTKKK